MDVVAEVVRSGLVESRHRGVAVRVDPAGEVLWSIGDPSTEIYPRSANKPFQAAGLLRAGLDVDGADLAIAAASHSAEPFHLERVRSLLASVGLDESSLQTPASYPVDPHEHAAVLRAGEGRLPIRMDCSGKHAAMLVTCVRRDWSTDDYLDPQHPVQRVVAETFADLVAPPSRVGIDGCGAPLFATSLVSLASGVAGLMAADPTSDAGRVASAMVAHPELVSGTRRPDLVLARAVPGALVKSGAESVVVVGLPEAAGGGAVAGKIEDGGERALFLVVQRALQLAGVEADLLEERPAVLGGGRAVGEIRPAF